MPRGKKNADGPGDDTRNGADKPKARGRAAPRARRATAETVVVSGVEAGGVPVAATAPVVVGVEPAAVQGQLTDLQRHLAEITRQAREARDEVKALRDERAQIGKELGELRQQVRAAQEQSLRETREGYAKVGHELTTTAGRLGEAVRHAQQELADVVRQAREARRELEEVRRTGPEVRREEAAPVVVEEPSPRARKKRTKEAAEERAEARPVEARNRLGVTVGNGVVVAEVQPDSPAAAAGLTRGDVIEEVNETGIVNAAHLRDAVLKTKDNEDVTLRVFRAGQTHEIKARLADADDANGDGSEHRNRLGVTVGPGVVVAEVLPDTPAAAAGLATGDVIDDLNGREISNGEELRDLVHGLPAGEDAVLRVTRAGEVREVRVKTNGAER
jgi:cell division septum initiation protein DivIVA